MARVEQITIDNEVARLRRYLRRPRTIEEICERYGWSMRTALRRVNAAGETFRVVPVDGRRCRYVRLPGSPALKS